jgi:hypothetical protein
MENLQRLYDLLEEENEHSINLVLRCVLDERLDLIDQAALVAVNVIEKGELAGEDYEIQRGIVTELYEARMAKEREEEQAKQPHPRVMWKNVKKGGCCRGCGGVTTYTRQNSEKGLCFKCEHEGVPKQ